MQILSHYYYKCSPEFLNSINTKIEKEINQVLNKLNDKKASKSLFDDFFLILLSKGWAFSQIHAEKLTQSITTDDIIQSNTPEICKISSSIEIETTSDFAKKFGNQLLQLNIQAYDLEEIASDIIKFRIAFAEKRIQAGIEIIIQNDNEADAFENVKDMLVKLDVDCPVWVIGIA